MADTFPTVALARCGQRALPPAHGGCTARPKLARSLYRTYARPSRCAALPVHSLRQPCCRNPLFPSHSFVSVLPRLAALFSHCPQRCTVQIHPCTRSAARGPTIASYHSRILSRRCARAYYAFVRVHARLCVVVPAHTRMHPFRSCVCVCAEGDFRAPVAQSARELHV